MALDSVRGEADELRATLGELRLKLRERAELGGADGRVVLGMGEEDDPFVADEFVEIDVALSRLGLEVGSGATETERFGVAVMVRHVDLVISVRLVSSTQTMQTCGVAGHIAQLVVPWCLLTWGFLCKMCLECSLELG